jgi:hypothetical protein
MLAAPPLKTKEQSVGRQLPNHTLPLAARVNAADIKCICHKSEQHWKEQEPSFHANPLPASAEDIAWPSSGIEPWWRISCALCRGKEKNKKNGMSV